MKGPVTQLPKVKQAREETALRLLGEAREVVVETKKQLVAKREELEAYRAERPRLENGLYDEILNKEVSMSDIEELNAKIAKLREHEKALAEEEADIKKAVDAAIESEQQARVTWQAAEREVDKVKELLKDLSRKERRELERQADAEIEEFSGSRRADNIREPESSLDEGRDGGLS
ncbi:MAG: YscO family type III secretion system apparatus protein [Pseudomonadota bacterium]